MAGLSAASVVATVRSAEVAPLTHAPAKRLPSAFWRRPARVPASASLTRRVLAWSSVRRRSRFSARRTAGEGLFAPSVSAAEGAVVGAGGSTAAAAGSAVSTSALSSVSAAQPAEACLWTISASPRV